ncbi:YbaN family protein [uncultured Veillonella sp.]|uniref:YbaN family protein n=1 Tax=uncultured Veillonella sp. TaxID=159268 RepID=UPI0025EEC0F6|nr:YbaN family protein [uncultured Veillonella sp.]
MKTTEQHSNVVVRYVFLTIGAISFVLGTAGIVLPLLPTVPFYMLTLFCLARGSERFHKMFLESSLYQKTVGAYERDKALTLRTKLSILASVTTIMAIGAYFSQNMPVALIVMGLVWVGHVIALAFIVKTKK